MAETVGPPKEHRLIIIGAGFAGLGLAIRLRQRGIRDFLILEAESGVGGTWWLNRYPGCACDVQSHLYSLSFAPKADWSRQFAPRAEIQAHLDDCVERFDLRSHLRLDTRLEQARWQDETQDWKLLDQHGREYRTEVLVSAIGGLSRPAWPKIPGLETFSGAVFHSQRWPEDLELKGKRVAVIGGGASAIQFVPRIAQEVAQLDFYQRTPQWILPKPDRSIPTWKQSLYRRLPPTRLLRRLGLYLLLESRLPAFNWSSRLTWFHRRKALEHLHRQVADPAMRQALTPDYAMGCKRVLMSNDFYPALNRKNVELIPERIERIEVDRIVDRQGRSRPAEVLILATGFQATRPIPQGLIQGRNGRDLAEAWADGPRAYKGTTVPGFPNFFTLLGPNTALGHNSVLLMIEAQIRYLLSALDWQDEHPGPLEVRHDREAAWNQALDARLERSVWSRGGCGSWYLHPSSGRNTTLWPDFTWRFAARTSRFDPDAYRRPGD
ncbi:flavin-containing monooxygenase [Wenzhouxiangella marina]|uniref:Putative flavin-binding monooxygenase-like protein n=1 Tax=Wenzhouxiangella marina TaxID=1579979 RepID=A0A0K0XVL5_9GAMM|nr:NAD(P)/FAD-dependent oxidoreductase [Wenzhouxiangella marina]AKS41713.1 Putative flavin-binding monooxygenase-like protein [Wenzhouxiangella marina]MBB6086525.1 cation diffusion facilitator CzcD-associated flavoprotein CzcO [Wenzhouxiangella marina]